MEEKIILRFTSFVNEKNRGRKKELRKTSLPALLYGGISDTLYLFNGKVKKVMEESVKRKRFWYLASV